MFSSYFGLGVLRFSFKMAHLGVFYSLNIIALKCADDITCKRNALTGSKYQIKYMFMYNGSACVYSQQVFIKNKECVESNRNPGYYTLVARYYLCTIPNHSSFWYRTIIVNEVDCMYLKRNNSQIQMAFNFANVFLLIL